jgi:uncharacterized protein YndB with AHSA1/START domain
MSSPVTEGRGVVTVERVIAAPAQRIFDILAAPKQHALIDGSGTVTGVQPGTPERLSKGAKFGMEMKLGASYKTLNTVIEFEEPTRIAWRHFSRHVWRYDLTQIDDNHTRVVEQWDPRPAKSPLILRLMGFPKRNRKGMVATLERLEKAVVTPV